MADAFKSAALNRRLVRSVRAKVMQPGDRAPSSGSGFVTEVTSGADVRTRVNEDGNTVPPLLWDVDQWDEGDWS